MVKKKYVATQVIAQLIERHGPQPELTYDRLLKMIRDGRMPAERGNGCRCYIDIDVAAEVLGLVEPVAA